MSERDLTSGMSTAIASGLVRPAIFYEGTFFSGGVDTYLRLWTGIGSIAWNGYTWTGGGNLLAISPIEESGDIKAIGFSVSLSGMPTAAVSIALQSVRSGKPGKLWLGLFDASGSLIADPYLLRRGRFDIDLIDDDGENCTITAKYEDRLVDLERPRERRYTSEDQKIDYPADKGFDFVPALQDTQLVWGH